MKKIGDKFKKYVEKHICLKSYHIIYAITHPKIRNGL